MKLFFISLILIRSIKWFFKFEFG